MLKCKKPNLNFGVLAGIIVGLAGVVPVPIVMLVQAFMKYGFFVPYFAFRNIILTEYIAIFISFFMCYFFSDDLDEDE